MDVALLFRSILLGFSIAAPVGPIGVLVIRRTLSEGHSAGLATGLGAATADAFYGLVGALGLTVLSSLLVGGQGWLKLFGGLFLCYLGWRTFTTPPSAAVVAGNSSTHWRAYGETFLLTLTNPATILSFTAMFASLGVGVGGAGATLAVVGGVFIGSALWWLALCAGVSLLKGKVTAETRVWINRLSGAVILTFGVVAIVSGLIS